MWFRHHVMDLPLDTTDSRPILTLLTQGMSVDGGATTLERGLKFGFTQLVEGRRAPNSPFRFSLVITSQPKVHPTTVTRVEP